MLREFEIQTGTRNNVVFFNTKLMCLYFNMVQLPVQLFKLEQLADKEVSVAVSHLGVSDVDHVVVNIEIQL